jgi:hypothetical protein
MERKTQLEQSSNLKVGAEVQGIQGQIPDPCRVKSVQQRSFSPVNRLVQFLDSLSKIRPAHQPPLSSPLGVPR